MSNSRQCIFLRTFVFSFYNMKLSTFKFISKKNLVLRIYFCFTGFVPYFLRNRIPTLKPGPGSPTLYYFSESEDDGVNVKWAHGINSRTALQNALSGKN